MGMEEIVMELIVNGGEARSNALEAVEAAGRQEFKTAEKKMAAAKDFINKAHHFQTDLIQAEADGKKSEVSLLMVHGQDHLMNAMTVMDMADQMIKLYRVIYQK